MNFVTVFPSLENVHLFKDVGMIPKTMAQNYKLDCYILCYENKNIKLNNNDIKLLELKKYSSKATLNIIIFLIKYSKKIDILNLYHIGMATIVIGLIYKMFNNKGKVYIKMDTNIIVANEIANGNSFFLKFLKKMDLISAETEDVKKIFEDLLNIPVLHLPNGIEKRSIIFKPKEKKKIILTVGRLGAIEKNTDFLVNSFINILDYISAEWKLYLVGPMTTEFKKFLYTKFDENEYSRERIVVLGEITDRCQLEKLYIESSIFALTSTYEGFSLAGIEALARGNFLLTSNISCFNELNCSGKFGLSVNISSQENYESAMIKVCKEFEKDRNFINYDEMRNFVESNYTWDKICEEIINNLQLYLS